MHECCFQKDFLSPANRSDLEREWMRTAAYALGCRKVNYIRTEMSGQKYSDRRFESFVKKHAKEEKEYPDSYSGNFYDMGIDHWEAWTTKTKILDHKRQQVQVRKKFKTKPSKLPAGAVLKEIHRFKCDADYRSYDPWEHSGESREEYIRKESLAVQERYGILPVVYQETKTRKIEGGRGM